MATATEHRKKLELKANVPVDVRFKFPKPMEREGPYGPYDLWTVAVNGEDHSLFATNGLKDALREAAPQAGEVLRLVKTEREKGRGFTYHVERLGGSEHPKTEPDPGEHREQATIRAYTARYVGICKELARQWPELHEKDQELFKSAASSIFIQMSRNGP